MSRPRAKRPVRTPFVVTLAAAATILAPACGGRVDGAPTTDAGDDTQQPAGCPTSTPNQGESCSGDISCMYEPNSCGFGTTATCQGGQWSVMRMSCNPPPPTPSCPATEPEPGSPCWQQLPGGCTYADRCLPGQTVVSYCDNGQWSSSFVEMLVACPSTAPVDGTSCAECAGRYPSSCAYEYCGMYPSREAQCDPITKTWRTLWTSCNPPPPDGGWWGEDTGPADTGPSEDAGSADPESLP
jgi:hypothetical protein